MYLCNCTTAASLNIIRKTFRKTNGKLFSLAFLVKLVIDGGQGHVNQPMCCHLRLFWYEKNLISQYYLYGRIFKYHSLDIPENKRGNAVSFQFFLRSDAHLSHSLN